MSAHTTDGGPAFPQAPQEYEASKSYQDSGLTTITSTSDAIRGMSLRDYFAAHAPKQTPDADSEGVNWVAIRSRYAGALGIELPTQDAPPIAFEVFWATVDAKLRYIHADAMLLAREAKR